MNKLLRFAGKWTKRALVGLGALTLSGAIIAYADYALTQGSGTTFASVVISTKHYVAYLICDATAGETQCATVTAAGAVKTDGSAVTQPVNGTVTANLGTIGTAATATNQSSQITQETSINTAIGTTSDAACGTSTGTCSAIALIKYGNQQASSTATNTGAAVPAGGNLIGNVGTLPPAGSTSTNGSATGTTAATSTTLGADATKTEYACWISIRANATAAATGNATLSDGTKTFNFTQWTAPNASGVGVIEEIFNPCIPATAVNTAWTLTSAAPGTGGVVSVSIGGFKL